MVCAYSIRAKQRPPVSTPVTWSEIEAALDAGDAGALTFGLGDVLERVAERGDLFAPVLSTVQPLAAAALQPSDS